MIEQGVSADLIVAHRGYAAKHPENTVEALEAALAAGINFLEIDVQLSSDHIPFLLHDTTLERTLGLSCDALTSTSNALKKAGLETLSEAIALLEKTPKAQLFVELKEESISAHGLDICLQKISDACAPAIDRCIFISFSYEAAEAAAKHFSKTGWVLSQYTEESLEKARRLSPDYIFIDTELTTEPLPPSPWLWVAYEVGDLATLKTMQKQGADLFESKAPEKIMNLPTYDYVVVGGGIHGTGIALSATAAGHSVLLIEKTAIAHGTSSKSSKLIHGGLRYLETAQLKLVHECLSERKRLLKLAPDLVRLEPFYIPVYKNTRRPPWLVALGLTIYAVLGGLRKSARFSRIPKSQWHLLEGLKTENLRAVFKYYDGATNDKLLTEAVMRTAQGLGAELAMPAEFTSAKAEKDINVVSYTEGEVAKKCKARILVNASGPWANILLDRVDTRPEKLNFDLISGSHIVVDRLSPRGMFYVESPTDGRAVFIMPWYGKMMIGTTEKKYEGDPAKVEATEEEVTYLLKVANEYLPELNLKREDVVEKFAGLRVLPHAKGRAFSRPRETTFHRDKKLAPRVVTVYGGKLTAYRVTAEKFVKKHAGMLPNRKKLTNTNTLRLQ